MLSLLEDGSGHLWIGTEGGGLNRLDARSTEFVHYRHDPADASSLRSSDVMALTQDRGGVLWVGTFSRGLNRFDRRSDGSRSDVSRSDGSRSDVSATRRFTRFEHDTISVVAAGDTVVEFDPYDAQKEEADGRDDLTAAQAKIARAESDAVKNERSHTLDRDVARDELDRAETFELTDEYLYTRHQIVESQLDKELYATRADVAGRKLDASGELSTAERELGRIDAGKARLKLDIAEKSLRSLQITAPHDGILVLERNWRGETAFVGDTLWPGQKIAESSW